MVDLAMQELFMTMMTGMIKDLIPGGNFECQFSICDFTQKSYTSVINSYYGNFEMYFDNGDDASEFIDIAPTPSGKSVPDGEGDFSGEDVPLKVVICIPLLIGAEAYISVKQEKLKDWFENYETLGNINFKMESVYPMQA